MWDDVRRLLELYDHVGEFDVALAEAAGRLHQDHEAAPSGAPAPAGAAPGPGVVLPFPPRGKRA